MSACLKLAFGDQNGRVDSKRYVVLFFQNVFGQFLQNDKDVGEGRGNKEASNNHQKIGNVSTRNDLVEGVQKSETSLIEDSASCSSTESNSSAVVTAEEWYLEEPRWGPGLKACPEIRLTSVELYERLALDMELTVQRLIQQDNYNTIGNFVRFYNDYLATSSTCHPVQLRLSNFYRNYIPQLIDTEKTCVGLGLSLLHRLNREFGPSPGIHLVSSEEGVEDLTPYRDVHPSQVEGTEKEHVMVCMRVCIEDGGKERRGVLLLDPGYHVARAITVMYDLMYPHTGWFTQCDEPWVKKEFCYYFAPPNSDGSQSDYVVWETKETRAGGRVRQTNSLVYVGQPFINAVEVTEKRNLVYEMRSWLSRNTKGEIVAGVYFPVRSLKNISCEEDGPKFTLRYSELRQKPRITIPFSKIYLNKMSEEESEQIERCNRQMGLYKGHLMSVLIKVALILSDTDFVAQLLDINNEINCLAS